MGVGDRIKEARKAKGWTQSSLAEKSGVATITISQYETGKRKPRIEQLEAISNALEVPLFYLLNGAMYTTTEKAFEEYKDFNAWKAVETAVTTLLESMYGKSGELEKERIVNGKRIRKAIRIFRGQNGLICIQDEYFEILVSTVKDVVSSLVRQMKMDENTANRYLQDELDINEAMLKSGFEFDNMEKSVRFKITAVEPIEE